MCAPPPQALGGSRCPRAPATQALRPAAPRSARPPAGAAPNPTLLAVPRLASPLPGILCPARASHASFRRAPPATLAALLPADPRSSTHARAPFPVVPPGRSPDSSPTGSPSSQPRASRRQLLSLDPSLFLICGTVPMAGAQTFGTSVFGLRFPGRPILDVKLHLVLPLSSVSIGGQEYQICESVGELKVSKDAPRLKEELRELFVCLFVF